MIEARLPRPLPFDPGVLAERFGTPLYVYDLDAVAARVRTLREHLPDRFVLAYAVKANPALAVVARIGGLGVGMDVASAGELATVLRAGVSPDEIVFTGPGKRDDELLAALQARIRAVTVESLGELHRLETLASARGQVMPVLVRAAITGPREGRRIIGGPGARKFGMRLPDVRRAARLAARSSSLELLGLHAFGASNVRDGGTLVRHIRRTVELGRDVAAGAGVPLRLVDVGGGLGIPYTDGEEELDLERFGHGLRELDRAWSADPALRGLRVLIEPGRYLVGPAGWYVARVLDTKRSGGHVVAIVDGGIHHLLAPALVGREQRVTVHSGPAGHPTASGGPHARVLLAGPLCTGLDVLARRVRLARVERGDLVAVSDAGAYGFTESMPLFLSHPWPAEVALLGGGEAQLVRPRIEPDRFLSMQLLPADLAPVTAVGSARPVPDLGAIEAGVGGPDR